LLGAEVGEVEDDGHQLENFTCWLARLSEMRVPGYETGILWSYPALTCIFQKKYQATAEDVRVMSMWLIYARKKVWTHAQKRRARKTGWPRKKYNFYQVRLFQPFLGFGNLTLELVYAFESKPNKLLSIVISEFFF
jgi:hypothetical protein